MGKGGAVPLMVIVIVLFLLFLLFIPGLLLGLLQTPIAGFHPDKYEEYDMDGMSVLHQEIYERKDAYETAVGNINAELIGIARNYGLGWGILASLDLMAFDEEIKGYEFAEILQTYAEYTNMSSKTTVWKSKEYKTDPSGADAEMSLLIKDLNTKESALSNFVMGNGEENNNDYDLNEFYIDNTIIESEVVVTRIDMYKGIIKFEYEKGEEHIVTGLSSDGYVSEVTVIEKYFLRNINYEPNWTRLKNALKLRWGDADDDPDPSDGDIILIEEWGMRLQRGIMDFSSLEAATTLAEYKGGPFSVYMSGEGYVWPVEGCYYVSSPFGIYRSIPSIGVDGIHTGIDIPASVGTNALATIGGVIGAIYETGGGGRSLRLDGYDGCTYHYLHLAHWGCSYVGMDVEAGDVIAGVGSTGKKTTGSHLHFEAHINGVPVDPIEHCGWQEVIN